MVVVVVGGALGESANLSQRVQNGSSKLLSSAVVGEKAQLVYLQVDPQQAQVVRACMCVSVCMYSTYTRQVVWCLKRLCGVFYY